jgi:hypothetical protein
MRVKPTIAAMVSVLLCAFSATAETTEYKISIKNHMFEPAELKVPADTKLSLLVKNEDPTPEEFESHDLKREKVIKGGKEATILVGPLKPGRYTFFGEFNEKTAQGVLIVE